MYRYLEKKAFLEEMIDPSTAMTMGSVAAPLALGAYLFGRGKVRNPGAAATELKMPAVTKRISELGERAGTSGMMHAMAHPIQSVRSAFGTTTDVAEEIAKHHDELDNLRSKLTVHKAANPHVDIDPHITKIDATKEHLNTQLNRFNMMGKLGVGAGVGLGGYHLYKRWNPEHKGSLSDRISQL